MTVQQLLLLSDHYDRLASYERSEEDKSIFLIKWFELQVVLCRREASKIAGRQVD